MKRKAALLSLTLVAVALVWVAVGLPADSRFKSPNTWHRLASPGPLSRAHSALEGNCNTCHTPIKGVEPANCMACHANDRALLERQPTAFHADIGSCSDCHPEHRGVTTRPSAMDHAALALIGIGAMKRKTEGPRSVPAAISNALAGSPRPHDPAAVRTPPALTPEESQLNCASCHDNQDRHRGLFGKDCASCHTVMHWTISQFRHPSPQSKDCVQCHQAPPSHYMMHFEMVSMKVAGQEHAEVSQCYLCHQTTAWNDIRGVGWYKHH
ncbi:cytochrome c3 family protein [Candidatus Sumerlaeota bacterium]|nr:cytochrome c3 family protein [Candidatus Sumerlaeota bacterium]